MIQRFALRHFNSDSLIGRYGVAFLSLIIVLAVRLLLQPVLGNRSQYIIFLLAVLITAWYSGSLPALLVLALGAFLGNFFFGIPVLQLKFETLNDAVAVSFYVVVGVAIVALFEMLKRHERQLATQIIKQAEVEKALRMSEDRFRLVTEALEGAIYDWDAVAGTAYRSSGLYEIVGYQPNEVPNTRKWWQDQMHPDDFAGVQESLQKTLAEHAPIHSVEYRVRHKDGHYIWVWDKSRILYNDGGQLIRLVGCTLSIDERKHLSESLIQTEERFRVAFENASDAMVISDADGIVVAANEAYFHLYGYSAEEVIGHSYVIIYPEEARQQSLERYKLAFDTPQELPFFESTVRRKDGTIRIVEARAGFVAQHGQRQFMLSVIRDLTERKQAEVALYSRYQLTADLAQAVTLENVAQITVNHLMNHFGAVAGSIYVYHAGENTFTRLYENAPLSSEESALWDTFPADPTYPFTTVVKQNRALWFTTAGQRDAAYPVTKQFAYRAGGGSVILPLVVASEVFGVIGLSFSEDKTFTEDQRTFITSLVFQCAQAVERARLAEKTQTLAVIEERHRLARDLHDNVSQLLFSSSVISEMLPRLLQKSPDKALEQAEQLHLMVRGAMAEMRTLLWELRPENIIQTPLSGLLTQLAYAAQSRQEARVSFDVHAQNELLLSPDAQVAFYRIAQEGLHNVLKHGQAAAVSIRLRQTDNYTALVIADKGQGFDTTTVNSGFGLTNMQERATRIGARFSIKSHIGKGTRIRLIWSDQKTG